MIKRIVALVVVFSMAFSTIVSASTTAEVEDDWSYVGFVHNTLKVKEDSYKEDRLYYYDVTYHEKSYDVLERYIVRFKSTKPSVVTVDKKTGDVYGLKAGTARIKVTIYNYDEWGDKVVIGRLSHKVIVKSNNKLKKKTMKLFVKDKEYVPVSGNRSKYKKWRSKNPRIAKVTKNGKIIAKRKGKTRITCKVRGKRRSVKVIVRRPYIWNDWILDGASYWLTIRGHSGWGKKFRSSNPSVIKVSKYGKLTAKRTGKAVISCKTDGIWIKKRLWVKKNQCTFKKSYKSLSDLYWGTVRVDPRKLYFSGRKLMLKVTILNKTDNTKRKLKYFKIKIYQNGKHILSKSLHNKYVNVKSFRKKNITWCLGTKRRWKRKLRFTYKRIRIKWDMYP